MGSFVKLDQLDPYELLASKLRLSRRPMTLAFDEAFRAYLNCHDILREVLWQDINAHEDWLTTLPSAPARTTQSEYDSRARQYTAQVEDNLADWQASIVLLFADDTLQCFARGVLPDHRSLDGYGPSYPDASNSGRPVHLTTLLRAGTNALRHVSEWDAADLPFPYPILEGCKDQWRRPLENIDVIQRAFGLGRHERIRDVVSMRILIRVDGTLGNHGTRPSYARFESAIVNAARDIARRASGEAYAELNAHLEPLGYAALARQAKADEN